MEIAEYKNIYKNEGNHFFYVSTHQLIISLIDSFVAGKKRNLKILDAGCGTGLLAKKLQKFGDVTGVDFSTEALYFAKKRGIKVKRSSVEKLPFENNVFDIVLSIDVIASKSIKNDLLPLIEFYRVLKPGGILILRVSANKWLRLIHDKHVHLGRRYERKELFEKLSKVGFIVEKLSFIHSILFPLIVLRHVWEKISRPKATKSAIEEINPLVNSLLTQLLLIEAKLFTKFDIPFGVGLVSVCKKP